MTVREFIQLVLEEGVDLDCPLGFHGPRLVNLHMTAGAHMQGEFEPVISEVTGFEENEFGLVLSVKRDVNPEFILDPLFFEETVLSKGLLSNTIVRDEWMVS